MAIIIAPRIIQDAVERFFASHFQNAPQREHFANYLTGLIISENKTVSGMSNEMPNASDQSCLNRFMKEVEWDAHAVNMARINLLQQFEDTQFHPRGIIAIDDVLLDKSGDRIPDSGTFWDHSEQRYKHAQDMIIVHYVNPFSKKHYPLEFKRFKKEEQCEWTGEEFKKMTALCIELIDWCHENNVLGNFTFDSFYTCAEIQNHIHGLKNEDGTERGYVGDLKFNRKIEFKGKSMKIEEFAHTIPSEDRKPVTVDGVKQWYLSVCVKMPKMEHKVRVVILWKHKNDAEPRKIIVTNKIHWNAERIIETYRGRWTGTETPYFSNTDRDGKQNLGLGDCQLRNSEGQTRHTYCVFLAYSLLVQKLDNTSVSEWASVKLTTIGECCRALLRDSIRTMIGWVVEQMQIVTEIGGNAAKRLDSVLNRLRLNSFPLR
jgi:hypothetical protein